MHKEILNLGGRVTLVWCSYSFSGVTVSLEDGGWTLALTFLAVGLYITPIPRATTSTPRAGDERIWGVWFVADHALFSWGLYQRYVDFPWIWNPRRWMEWGGDVEGWVDADPLLPGSNAHIRYRQILRYATKDQFGIEHACVVNYYRTCTEWRPNLTALWRWPRKRCYELVCVFEPPLPQLPGMKTRRYGKSMRVISLPSAHKRCVQDALLQLDRDLEKEDGGCTGTGT